jgi:hypothetical protein
VSAHRLSAAGYDWWAPVGPAVAILLGQRSVLARAIWERSDSNTFVSLFCGSEVSWSCSVSSGVRGPNREGHGASDYRPARLRMADGWARNPPYSGKCRPGSSHSPTMGCTSTVANPRTDPSPSRTPSPSQAPSRSSPSQNQNIRHESRIPRANPSWRIPSHRD